MSLARHSTVPSSWSVGVESLLSLGHISSRKLCRAPSCGYTQASAVERGNVGVPARGRTWLQGEQNLLPACQGNIG